MRRHWTGCMATAALAMAAMAPPGAASAQVPITAPQPHTVPQITAPGSPAPQSYLWIGNSFFYFNNGITAHVAGLERGMGGPVHRSTMATIGGSGMDWHDVESYFRPGAVGAYNFDAQNNIIFNTADKKFDAAVLMDCSQCPIHPALAPIFLKTAQQDTAIVRRHGAIPILFMSWAYLDKPEMTAQLAEAYTKAGNDDGALVIPAGLAFARALKDRPGLQLYIADNRHPTLAGTYLAAATSYGALNGRSPEPSTYTAGLDPELATFLRATAWATVQAYYGGDVVN